MWNSLPQELREITSVEQFRSQISTWSGGSAHARSVQTVKFYVHLSVVLMLKSSVFRVFNASLNHTFLKLIAYFYILRAITEPSLSSPSISWDSTWSARGTLFLLK